METTYCPLMKTLYWLQFKCDEITCSDRLESDFEGCLWVPVAVLRDSLSESILNRLLAYTGQFYFDALNEPHQI